MSKKTPYTATFNYIKQQYSQNTATFSLIELHEQLAQNEISVPERTLRRWLSKWIESNQVLKTGQKRGTRYQLSLSNNNTANTQNEDNTPQFIQSIEPAKRPATLAKLRDAWTHSSTAIEGNTLSLGDTNSILELGLTVSGKPLREHHEVIGHAKAIDLIYATYAQELTKQRLFDLHKAVQTEVTFDIYQPVGEWKVEKNFSNSINSKGEQVTIEYAAPNQVDRLMGLLIEGINKWDTSSINKKNAPHSYAKIHLAFVHIHPFADGNGRLARLISNIVLLKAGLPPLLIDHSKRREYITLLADYQSQTPTPTKENIEKEGFWSQPEKTHAFENFCEACYQQTIALD